MRGLRRDIESEAGSRPARYAGLSFREARALFCAENRLSSDGGESAGWWSIRVANLAVRLPNFAWRRHALQRHDLHHVLTGYACSPVGEMEMAAWEFSAGRCPSRLATAFCLPLIGLGALIAPRATFAAFRRGRISATLYRTALTDELLDADVGVLSGRLAPAAAPRARPREIAAYCGLVCRSLVLMSTPFGVGAFLIAVARAMH